MVNRFRLSQTVTYGLCSILILFGGMSASRAIGLAQGTSEEVSVTTDSNPPTSSSNRSKISADGRYVYFISNATNLVLNDTNNAPDLFVRDRLTNTTTLLSVNSAGQQANSGTYAFDVSDGGRYVVFSTGATNLVTPDYNSGADIYLRDTKTNQTSLIFRNSFTGQSASKPVISGNGNWVAFTTRQPLAPDSDPSDNVYLINRQTLTLTRISNGIGGAHGAGSNPAINYDGSVISFDSGATNLVSNDTNGQTDVFVWQRSTGNISRVSISSASAQANNYSQFSHISGDGNRIIFDSYATNLASNATAINKFKVFVHEMDSGATTLINQTPTGLESNDQATNSAISENGNFVSFNSYATNLVTNDTNGTMDYFVRNLEDNTTALVSLDSNGNQYTDPAFGWAISADGQYNLFDVSYRVFLRF